MIIIGHRFIPSKNLFHVNSIDAIKKTPSSSCIYLEFCEENLEIINHARANNILFALSATTVAEVLYASNLGASYILTKKNFSNIAQNLANEYLFDAKILSIIEEEAEIEELALQSIDGVIFANAIIKTPS